MWELHTFPCSIQVSHVQLALLTEKCSGPVGLAVEVHYVCSPQGGSQHQQRHHLAWHVSGDGKETCCRGEDLPELVLFRMSNLHMIFLCIMISIFYIELLL